MIPSAIRRFLATLLADYSMVLVLLLICAFLSVITYAEQHPTGPAAARGLAAAIAADPAGRTGALIVVRDFDEDAAFAAELKRDLEERGVTVVGTVSGQPADARRAIARLGESGTKLGAFACNAVTASWTVFEGLGEKYPSMAGVRVFKPESYRWPNFLKGDNLLNIANQIAVIAIIAIGMTMVIITGGIDLSVGSLIALSAVVTARLIRDVAGAESASATGMVLCSLAGILTCATSGAFSGVMVTYFRIPPFIVTLAMMLVASGAAAILSDSQSINQVPDSFIWLGRGTGLLRLPNAVLLMLGLYILAHILMTRMVIGRYIYAVGGNPEAARLSGVPVHRVLLVVYILCGALAGLGGVVMASQLKSGSPNYGQMYELSVIAAVVVGGTSLAGGAGKVLGSLTGVFIIAVIQNGMNLRGVRSETQKIVLGLVILGAVLLDRLKHRGRR
jgi:ribose transport system permease protein